MTPHLRKLTFAATVVCCLLASSSQALAQSCFWVFLTDKEGTSFDPYSYFDAKAIERYKANNANLFDITNYPLNSSYVSQIDAIAAEEVGTSRWLNAVAVMATDEQIARIESLPFVAKTDLIATDMEIAACAMTKPEPRPSTVDDGNPASSTVTNQLLRMQGDLFAKNGIDGSGIRVAVFDGGFHAVNTHKAFKHLRDSGRIVATWDFTKKRENVYDNHTHGTMVLSCIAGVIDGKQLGLATGATFLLAKTEVDPEPFKEEVWWAQAAEWADKNGVDIINSSLGYGKDRHYTWEMDSRSYVARAANLAASKGILICNSAGNEGDDKRWKTIITPADADSVLCVGGINPSLTSYSHINFSSYGPSADGRLKPNVCNFGYCEVADPHNDEETDFAYGTSFSSPLTTGFCACAYQCLRDKKLTAMQMKSLIEQSADLYPYYDYAFGYGVPQASFFVNYGKCGAAPEPTFRFVDRGDYIFIQPLGEGLTTKTAHSINDASNSGPKENVVMFKIQDSKGLVLNNVNLGMEKINPNTCVAVPKTAITEHDLVAHVNGYTNTFRLPKTEAQLYGSIEEQFTYHIVDTAGYYIHEYSENDVRSIDDNKVGNWGVGQKYLAEVYVQYGIPWFFGHDMLYSDCSAIGLRLMRYFKKWYALGLAMEYSGLRFNYNTASTNIWDNTLSLTDFSHIDMKKLTFYSFDLELFQRIRLIPGGALSHKGLNWDLGIYGGLLFNTYTVEYNANQNPNACRRQTNTYNNVEPYSILSWGLTTRLQWDVIGLYARYRMSQPGLELPRLELGLQISF